MWKLLLLTCAVAGVCSGQQVIAGSAEGDNVSIEAKLYIQEQDIVEVLGHKLEEGVVVAEVTLTPTGEDPVTIWREDFFLHSQKDGQRSESFDPGQLAGDTVLVVSRSERAVAVMRDDTGPVWGDPRVGRPLPDPNRPEGFGTVTEERAASRVDVSEEPENELLTALWERVLPEEEISEPTTGLLYFPLDGNHNPRQLWLHYRGADERIDIRFERQRQ